MFLIFCFQGRILAQNQQDACGRIMIIIPTGDITTRQTVIVRCVEINAKKTVCAKHLNVAHLTVVGGQKGRVTILGRPMYPVQPTKLAES